MLLAINVKYLVLICGFIAYSIFVLAILRYLLKYPKFREFLLQSVQDASTSSKKVSGKSLSAVFLIHIVGFSAIVAVVYSKDHLLPSYFLDAILLFIAALFGINKIPTKGGSFANVDAPQPEQQVVGPKPELKNESDKKNKDIRKIIDNPDA